MAALEGVNVLVGPPQAVMTGEDDASPNGGGFGGLFRRADAVSDGSEWLVAVLVLGSLAFLIALRAGGIRTIIVGG